MLRSMYSGISGMKNFQTKLDVIGNNIANVNTFGFKKSRVTFKDTMNQMIAGASAATENRGGKNPTQVGLGSTLATIDTIHTGSSLQTTGRSLDLGIDGDGYFVVSQGDALFYTRAGNFYLDDNGTLVNADGLKVQAYKYAPDGKTLTNEYEEVLVNVNAVLPSTKTTKIGFVDNLSLNATDKSVYTQQIKIVDDEGNPQKIDVHFRKISYEQPTGTFNNEWAVYMNQQPIDTVNPNFVLKFDASGNVTQVSSVATAGYVTNPTASTPTFTTTSTGKWDYYNTAAVTTDDIDLDFTQLTQTASPTTALVNPDGNTEGKLESFNIGSMGEINGVYSNGQIVGLGRLALAKFSNSSGLTKAGNNLFQESINSGTPNINVAGEGRGTIASGSLEMSNVDLSEEFTEMITAQRGFQANTRIITTSDEILQELVNLKR